MDLCEKRTNLKGTLFCIGLDIELRKRSEGTYGVQDLVNDLRERYGPGRPFKDDELFGVITELTGPEIGAMLRTYLDEPGPLPLKRWFNGTGLRYDPRTGLITSSPEPTAEQLQLRK
jgi:predicted metalloprotease with PDZ domain